LYPSNIERQNVKSVLKVFDEKTIAGQQLFGAQNKVDVTGTGKFLEIVLRLWKILNVKSTGKGLHKRDSDSDPIRSVDANNVGYLEQVHQWLIKWDSLNQKVRHGRLSNETMFALKHTVATFIELIAFLFTDIGVSYVLTGKFQTDCLEFRFSQYRQSSGANYNVSVQELKESEKKLKIVSMLHVMSAAKGKISLKDFLLKSSTSEDIEDRDDASAESSGISAFLPALATCDDIELTVSETQSLVFIAGYVGYKVARKLSCDLCRGELVCDKTLQYDLSSVDFTYLSDLDRGGLRWPTDFLLEVVTQVFLVFRVIVSKDYEVQFLTCNNQKSVLQQLATERLIDCGTTVGECTCGTTMHKLANMTMSYIINICLNNYCKQAADKNKVSKQSKSLRKLSTLCK
jgi:hypothetical protein